jgi:hypothetical protein
VVSYEGEPPQPLADMLTSIPEVLADAQAQGARDAGAPAAAQPRRPWWKVW